MKGRNQKLNCRINILTGLILMMLVFASSTQIYAGLPWATANGEMPTLAPMLEKVTPSVVRVSTRGMASSGRQPNPLLDQFFGRRPHSEQKQVRGLGSGVVINAAKGLIVTNHHVIDNSDDIRVTLKDGREFDATLVGYDNEVDIAVLKIEAKNLIDLPFADSSSLRVGDFVVAIGTPFGLTQTVTSGIVSALGRSNLNIEDYENFIQTDASINHGNSGGALVNLKGELVGINTAILGPGGGSIGIGFAIPINMVRSITEQLVEHGEVRRGKLGVGIQDLTPDLAKSFMLESSQRGAAVSQVEEGSPAYKAGILRMDVIVAVNGKAIRNASDLRNEIGLLRAGSKVTLELFRDGKKQSITLKISKPEQERFKGNILSNKLDGATFGNNDGTGVLVTSIEAGSAAATSGLVTGDVIVSINRHEITSVAELSQIPDGTLLLNIIRDGYGLFLLIQ